MRVATLVIASASAVLGAVMAALPALIVGLVTLLYNSAGGLLVFLGNLIGLVPNPLGLPQQHASLPLFQQLDAHADALIVLRSVVATTLCFVAVAVIAVLGTGRNGRSWALVALCCLLASIIGGWLTALFLVPATAISLGRLIQRRLQRGR